MESRQAPSNPYADDPEYFEGDLGTSSNPRRAEDGRLLYCESQVQPREHYRGPLEGMSAEDVRFFLAESLSWSTLSCPATWPLPPAGLPGKLNSGYARYSDPADLISIGMGYMKAAIRSEGRGMHNRWRDAQDFIRKLERAIEERLRDEIAKEYVEREMRYIANTAVQAVYFIASEGGPIKIGISNNPRSRLSSLQTSHHDKLEILAARDGGADQERAYHQQFAAHRLHGEWFERHPDILAEIERINQEPSQ